MRIEHRQVEGQPLTVIIEYPKWSESVDNLVKKIGRMDISLVGRMDERNINISLSDIYYIENVDRKLFIYTEDEVYRLDGSMADVESRIYDSSMVRISRTCIMNTDYLKEIRQIRNSHLEAVMDNGEKLIVSRKYLQDIKRIFKRSAL
ncbi:MAG: LytTR family transcriptional regulator DNA-binding domain-containing protein [Butyrivibrio sp.]|jgi:DNA-binding LytR/AlgR family response regulator|nr:LytTR family DNA-binding domain-containing protein [Butyrivibrio sp.]MCR4634697.1 LytTR family transcriptional regulator DNA-binding domain-containing protein [Butyrivibrio sp.]